MKTELKDGIWIEGFNSEHEFRRLLYGRRGISFSIDLIYQGKTSEIPEDVAKKCVKTAPLIFDGYDLVDNCGNNVVFKNYETGGFGKRSGIRSIQSACKEPYCIVYKKK